MLKLRKTAQSHEDLFIERYEWLLGWSLQLTGHNQEQAEDLLHDAFVQFTLSRPDLNAVQNLEGYLYSMLRNMHVSQIRRAVRTRNRMVSILDHDSAEMGLRAADPHTEYQSRDELQRICHYACVRKETSKAGSVLILRFFHGYYPGEIAKLLRSPRRAVDDWLRIARKEARLHLQNPSRLSLLKKHAGTDGQEDISGESADFLGRLRQVIFRSRRGACLAVAEFDEWSGASPAAAIDCARLAHIASCPDCLDEINKRLGLPPLSERYPIDMIGPDLSAGGQPGKQAGAGQTRRFARMGRRIARDVFEHRPKELQLAVNGFIIGSQSIGSELSEQTLSINLDERVGFVEAFSEQGVRLMYLSVESPPDGPAEQAGRIELSDGRRLDLSINFSDIQPRLAALYYDPLLKPAYAAEKLAALEPAALPAVEAPPARTVIRPQPPRFTFQPRLSLFSLRWWLRPGALTTVIAILLIIALWLVPVRGPAVSASELLRQSVAADEALAGRTDVVIHRVVNLEERRPADDTVMARRRIEIWSNAGRRTAARRVYNDKNEMVAAEWTSPTGPRLVYRREAAQRLKQMPERQIDGLLEAGDAWQLDLSAKDYAGLVGRVDLAEVKERGDTYVINYQINAATNTGRLVKAMLTISRNDLHSIEQVLSVRQKDEIIQYRFAEQSFEPLATEKVAPAVFQIDSQLLGRNAKLSDGVVPAVDSVVTEPPAAGTVAIAALKVDALYELHRAGACLREQPEVTQTAEGALHIQAVVDSEARKRELLRALEATTKTAAAKVEIYTVAEAVNQYMKVPQAPAISRRVEIIKDQIPAYAELRRYFAKSGRADEQSSSDGRAPDGKVDEQIRQFANRVLNQSRAALLHVWALKHYTREVSEAELNRLDAATRARWQAVIREHLQAFEQETRRLGQELQPVFFAGATAESDEPEGTANLWRDVERLFKLASAHDGAVRRALTVSTDSPNELFLKTEPFRKSLKSAERLAARMQDF